MIGNSAGATTRCHCLCCYTVVLQLFDSWQLRANNHLDVTLAFHTEVLE